jgi:hypothetical protein
MYTINLLEHPGSNVKRQVKQLIHYMRGGPSMSGQLLVRRSLMSVKGMQILWIGDEKKTAKDWVEISD